METRENCCPTALGDVRVLDLADQKGNYCTKLLADLGADVLKIEPPGGDPTREIGPYVGDEPHPERSLYFFHFNTSKRSITLNIEKPEGRAIFRRLVERADVLVETYQPGYLDGLGLGYEALRELNRGLIMTSITGFGQTGPYRDYKSCDIVATAMGGLMSLTGFPEDPPVRPGASQGNHQAAILGAAGTMVALYDRDITGLGRHVDISMQEGMALTIIQSATQYYDLYGILHKRFGEFSPLGVPGARVIFPCRDGWVTFTPYNLNVPGGRWEELVEWMDSEGMAGDLKDEKWSDVWYLFNHISEAQETLARFLQRKTKQEIYEGAQSRGMLSMPVNTTADLLADVQLQARGFFVAVDHSELDRTLTYPGAPYRLTETPWRIARRAPLIGEHNQQVYEGELGYSARELDLLRAEGII